MVEAREIFIKFHGILLVVFEIWSKLGAFYCTLENLGFKIYAKLD